MRASPRAIDRLVSLADRVTGRAIGDSAFMTICSGFGCSTYEIRIDDVAFDGSRATVEVFHARDGDGAIGDNVFITRIEGQEVDRRTVGSPDSGTTFSVVAPASAGDRVSVEIRSQGFFGSVRASFVDATVPELPFDPDEVSVIDCSLATTTRISPGDEVAFNVQVHNENSIPADFDIVFDLIKDGQSFEIGRITDPPLTPLDGGNILSTTERIDIPPNDALLGQGDIDISVANATPA